MNKNVFVLLFYMCYFTVFTSGKDMHGTQLVDVHSPSLQNEPALNDADYTGKLDELFTLEMAAEISGFDAFKASKGVIVFWLVAPFLVTFLF